MIAGAGSGDAGDIGPGNQGTDERNQDGGAAGQSSDADDTGESDGAPLPLRVSTLEIFFDLVFAFTLIQLTSVLASDLSWLAVAQVLLVFGLLWWMYEGYAWLTNTRPPIHTAERFLLLVGMAGFLVVGLAIPQGFSDYGVVLGVGYLLVVLVHGVLYYRVNANIVRVVPFNVASALLVIVAGLLHDSAGKANAFAYALWILALAVQLGSPLIVHPKALFELRPAHFTERHSALLIVAIGESVAAVGIGAAGPISQSGSANWRVLGSAVLGLAVAAALWWIVFGSGDEERAERVLTQASSERRTALALNAFFYGNIPLLLGLVAIASGILRAILAAGGKSTAPASSGAGIAVATVLACGAALFLLGEVIIRRQLGTGPYRLRAAAALGALATTAVGATAGLDAQLAVVAAVLVAPPVLEREPAGSEPAGPGPASTHAAG
jgi:low temperature requirement protein LtrA